MDNIPCVPAPPVQSQIQQNTSLQITRKGAQQLLHKAVFDICAHEGFHSQFKLEIITLCFQYKSDLYPL